MRQKTILAIDMHNLLHKTFYVHQTDDLELLIKLAFHSSFITLNKYYKLYKPDKMICVFDRANWRVDYTKSEECYSKRVYKGTRRSVMTQKQAAQYEAFKQFILDFEALIRAHTSIISLASDGLEADDIIAGLCCMFGGEDVGTDNRSTYEIDIQDVPHDVVIVSADKDLLQLLRYKNVKLIDPATGRDRTLEKWNNDVDYFLYEKSITGDRGDNVQSALPRLWKSKILEAFNDEYKHTNLMKKTWVDEDEREMEVEKLVKENMLLTNLTHQPEHIQQLMWDTINYGMNNRGKYSHFHFLKFLGKYGLKNVSKSVEHFIPMLSK